MIIVVTAVIERADRRILIGQRRQDDTSPLKWEFPGGKVRYGELPEAALARELREELSVTLERCVELGRTRHKYASTAEELDIRFYAATVREEEAKPNAFERIAWVLPKDLANYDFLAANGQIVARLATGNIKPAEILERTKDIASK